MSLSKSVQKDLLVRFPELRPQMYFKSSLTALSHAMEDVVLTGTDSPLIIANLEQDYFYLRELKRYRQMARLSDAVYLMTRSQSQLGISSEDNVYETIYLNPDDTLTKEWHLVIISKEYTACLICRELSVKEIPIERMARFEGFWTFEPHICHIAAQLLLKKILKYRPDLQYKIRQIKKQYGLTRLVGDRPSILTSQTADLSIFIQRLVTYLQASQYKLVKTYKIIADRELKERSLNAITSALRSSLNPEEVLKITVRELGKLFNNCRCLLYRLNSKDLEIKIEYEYVPEGMISLYQQNWSLADNPLFLVAQTQERALIINKVTDNLYLKKNPTLQQKIAKAGIKSWLLLPIRYQNNILGILELHYGGEEEERWQKEDISLLEELVAQVGVAITQASAYTELVKLNMQLENLERLQSNLIAIIGHELRTPLSTIRVCLESLASEPNMPLQLRDTMLDTALTDAERLRQLIQDFLTLSKLETGKAYHRIEPIQIRDTAEIAIHRLETRYMHLPPIKLQLSKDLPLVLADAEGLVEIFTKLLDNACKFSHSRGTIAIKAKILNEETKNPMLEVIVSDTGRGIDVQSLNTIFNRFSQEEDFLQRSVSGTGLGLTICRQTVQAMGGIIWAESKGRDRGSQFHFTVPIDRI
jgi:DICT domain-containing protein/signal transduction histidine kinase